MKIKRERREREKLHAAEKKQNAVLSNMHNVQYNEEDFQSAFQKLTEAAMKYNKDSPGAACLQAFESISMPAHIFKEQCKIAFNIKLSLPELFSLVNYFEREHTGELDCVKFITNFLQIGYMERNNLIRKFHKVQRQKKEEERKALIIRDEESLGLNQNMNIVNYTYNENEFTSMMRKFVHIAVTYNSHRVNYNGSTSINSLLVFQRQYLAAFDFRSILKPVFGIRLTPKELGAMVSFFDIFNRKQVHVQTFLNALVQTNFKHRQFMDAYVNGRTKGRNEEDWIEEMIDELKEEYQFRISKQSNDKPWRSATAIGNFQAGRVFKRREHTSPADPISKYILRVKIARRTGRMDLSCKQIWATPEDEGKSDEVKESEIKNQENIPEASLNVAGSDESLAGSLNATSQTHMTTSLEAYLHSTFNGNVEPAQAKEDTEGDDKMKVLPIEHVYVDFRFHTLPSDVLKLNDLTELWLDNHMLTALPRKICDLHNIEILSVCRNQLTSLPAEICQCVNLRSIYLSGNKLTTLPNLFGRLTALEELDISHNSYTDFPEVLTSMSHLHYLDIAGNNITTLPMTMRQMKCLYVLNLEGLRLTRTPPVLLKLPYTEVVGYNWINTEKSAKQFVITPAEEFELLGMLKNRAALRAAENNRKKRSSLNK
ncbi:leucine-rich repeat domain-containing protein [archaeon]|nr:MAG: leucine-rich repeat domain-containing protein [archaeon]